jgi:hypothetical protein
MYSWYWYFQINQRLSIKKHAVHKIHRLVWDPYDRGVPGQLPSVPMRQDGTGYRDK